MSGPNSIRAIAATAIRQVNARYRQIPEEKRPDVAWSAADDVLEDALRERNRDRALEGIAAWRDHWLGLLEEASR